jgi:hypothetical protein
MKYLKRFLQSREKPPTKLTQPLTEKSFVSFVSGNGASPSVSSVATTLTSGITPIEPTIREREQEHRIRILSRRVSRKAAWRALKRIRPELRLNEYDRLELALDLALLDMGVDPSKVLEDVPQNLSDKIKTE